MNLQQSILSKGTLIFLIIVFSFIGSCAPAPVTAELTLQKVIVDVRF